MPNESQTSRQVLLGRLILDSPSRTAEFRGSNPIDVPAARNVRPVTVLVRGMWAAEQQIEASEAESRVRLM